MRIFIGSIEIAGIGKGLSSGFEKLGHEAHLITCVSHPFSYGGETSRSAILSAWQRLGDAGAKSKSKFIAFFLKSLNRMIAFPVFVWAAFKYDAFIYLFGCTLTRTTLELKILRYLKKKIIFVYLGSDARPSYMDVFSCTGDITPKLLKRIKRHTHRKFLKIRQQERYADYIVNAPSTAVYGRKNFISCFSVGVPIHVEYNRSAIRKEEPRRKVRILHAPSNPVGKGTALVEQAIQSLVQKGYKIDFVQLTGVTNSKVLDEISRCDFIVDQVYSDIPMPVISTEAASMGVPSVIGGYFSAVIQRHIDAENLPPSLFVAPDDLENAIEKMITDPAFRRELGDRARNFVRANWSPEKVAANYLRLLEDDVPDHWLRSPYEINYFKGAGISEQRLREVVAALTETYGSEALCLDDKPALKHELLCFARAK